MDHIVLNVEDAEGMVRFYTAVVGLAPERLEEFRTGKVPFPSVRIQPDAIIDLFPRRLWQTAGTGRAGRPNLNHFCLSMERGEWDVLRTRLEGAGVAREDGPAHRWGAHGTGVSVYFRDPEGNLVEARYYERSENEGACLLGS
jgi:catechol 2,3-dioxygenase-like lactoylglutathione lyase family enzyme